MASSCFFSISGEKASANKPEADCTSPSRYEKGYAGRTFLSHSGSSNKGEDNNTRSARGDAGFDDDSEFYDTVAE